MITLLTIVWYISAHGVYAQLANFDESDKSCRDLGHCRSVWDIIWSCLATIFSCSWVALHPNVPKQGKEGLWMLGRRVGAFGIALIAPEWVIMSAWNQRFAAKKLAAEHKDYKWTLTHGFFATMGGFMVHEADGDYILDPDDIGTYLDNGQIKITEREIQDKSKGDAFTKGFVVLQTSWFILQLIARAIQHLPITELEIATLAFAILNGATYALWWNKPLDVECPVTLSSHTPADFANGGIRVRPVGQKKRHQSLSFFHLGVRNYSSTASFAIFIVVGVLFGGIHCIAWVSHFPTIREKILWRVASVYTATTPVMFSAWASKNIDNGNWTGQIIMAISLFTAALYPIARLFLLVLSFTTLRSLPPDAYTTVHWTTFVPHI